MTTNNLKNMFYILPVMGYYFLESMLIAAPVFIVWRFVLLKTFEVYVSYFQWVGIIWIIKVIFFDVFKLITGLSQINTATTNDNKKEEQ
jgi:hypothetical protein